MVAQTQNAEEKLSPYLNQIKKNITDIIFTLTSLDSCKECHSALNNTIEGNTLVSIQKALYERTIILLRKVHEPENINKANINQILKLLEKDNNVKVLSENYQYFWENTIGTKLKPLRDYIVHGELTCKANTIPTPELHKILNETIVFITEIENLIYGGSTYYKILSEDVQKSSSYFWKSLAYGYTELNKQKENEKITRIERAENA